MIPAPAVVAPAPLPLLPSPAAHGPDAPLRSLAEALAAVPDHRGRQGRRHPFRPLLAAVYATLCGKHHAAAIADWLDAHYDAWLREALGFTQPARPCRTTVHLFLRGLDWTALEAALSAWLQPLLPLLPLEAEAGGEWEALALDGKEVRGVRRMSDEALLLVSAFTHRSGLTVALRACEEGQERATVRELLSELTLTGRVVTLDALHTHRETAAQITAAGGDYLLTVKANQPLLGERIAALFAPWQAPAQDRTLVAAESRGHGRREERTLVALSVKAGDVDWPDAAQVFCLTRTVWRGPEQRRSHEVVWGITSLSREEAGPERLLRLNRGHWGIENQSHWVRDAVCGEDRSLAYRDRLAEVLATVRVTALNLLRLHGVRNLAAQFRRNGDRPQEAARFLTLPLSLLVH